MLLVHLSLHLPLSTVRFSACNSFDIAVRIDLSKGRSYSSSFVLLYENPKSSSMRTPCNTFPLTIKLRLVSCTTVLPLGGITELTASLAREL